ncbi:MAG: hypothetical protein ABI036_10315 [Fibrobacteria bacterium]
MSTAKPYIPNPKLDLVLERIVDAPTELVWPRRLGQGVGSTGGAVQNHEGMSPCRDCPSGAAGYSRVEHL